MYTCRCHLGIKKLLSIVEASKQVMSLNLRVLVLYYFSVNTKLVSIFQEHLCVKFLSTAMDIAFFYENLLSNACLAPKYYSSFDKIWCEYNN